MTVFSMNAFESESVRGLAQNASSLTMREFVDDGVCSENLLDIFRLLFECGVDAFCVCCRHAAAL